jgi:dihydroorotate dehydrogenase
MPYALLRPLLFALEPERAHALTLQALRLYGRLPLRMAPEPPVRLMGLDFPNRLGLAAGFDKNAVAVSGAARLGFGFIEVGTVTPRPQPGNARPRVFRYPQERALINRSGFPSEGAAACAQRLRVARRHRRIVGVSIGKNADTPLPRAVDDYLACLRDVHDVADYVAVNISSPNTAQLRELHERARLGPLLAALREERRRLLTGTGRHLPIVLKLSPDLDAATLESVAATLRELYGDGGIDGVIATNTTIAREGLPAARDVVGGLSGAPLQELALATVRRLRELLGPQIALIGSGGVDDGESALALHAAGADLVQIYTGLVYRGPRLIDECLRALARPGPATE